MSLSKLHVNVHSVYPCLDDACPCCLNMLHGHGCLNMDTNTGVYKDIETELDTYMNTDVNTDTETGHGGGHRIDGDKPQWNQRANSKVQAESF